MSCARHLITKSQASNGVSAVRSVPLKIITVSKNNSRGSDLLSSEWITKLQRYTKVIEVTIKPNPLNAKDPEVAKNSEAERLLKAVDRRDRFVLLDERGRDMTSDGMAGLLKAASDEGCTCLTFAIGGPFGHAKVARARADDSIRLSSFVLNHSVAKIVLVEQLYRAWTILKGEPYHHR